MQMIFSANRKINGSLTGKIITHLPESKSHNIYVSTDVLKTKKVLALNGMIGRLQNITSCKGCDK